MNRKNNKLITKINNRLTFEENDKYFFTQTSYSILFFDLLVPESG